MAQRGYLFAAREFLFAGFELGPSSLSLLGVAAARLAWAGGAVGVRLLADTRNNKQTNT